ncbi:MAG: preprotein translocase subunit SecA [Candidatus Omnitrophica bacterium]|nr:preprotein translocase subunit SecA [Candidatus Omnitrophota bacterium]
MKFILNKIFGSQNKKELAKVEPVIEKTNKLESEISKLSDSQLRQKTDKFREYIKNEKEKFTSAIEGLESRIETAAFAQEKDKLKLQLKVLRNRIFDGILPEAFAVVREVARRTVGMRHFDVQLVGGVVMHEGKIAEMATGEGKTLVATLPAYLNALTGEGVHIVTVNDYLAKRDSEWMGPIYKFLGLSVGVIQHDMSPEARQKAYACDITYGTNNEFGFDYLRDNMIIRREDIVQRKFNFAIVDEVDSILVDESRTPLIISGPTNTTNTAYVEMKPVVDHISRLQRRLVEELLLKLKNIVDDGEKEEETKKLLYLIHKGSPKERQFLDLVLKNTKIKVLFDKATNTYDSKMMEGDRVTLLEGLYFIFDEKTREVTFTSKGEDVMCQKFNVEFIIEDLETKLSNITGDKNLTEEQKLVRESEITAQYVEQQKRVDSIKQLLKAYILFRKDVDYVIHENKIIIVDEFTGRMMPGRRFSDGIHESIEAKEGVEVQRESQTLATVTLQNFFRMYGKLAGMTGTAVTEADEFEKIYGLHVIAIPTNKPLERTNLSDVIYKTEKEKFTAICDKIADLCEKGRPVLVGTISIEKSETLGEMLKRRNIPHFVLNAKYHEMEAHIVAQAGRFKAVTIATNMAGRGTDILLGGNPEYLAEDALNNLSIESAEERASVKNKYLEEYRTKTRQEHNKVVELGGLHVIGTERHESRRVDNQLRGRAGRQGDPGSSRFYLSLEDNLMRIFGSDRIKMIMERLGMEEGQEIEHPLVTRAIRTAQKRVETQNFEIRKQLLKYDNVMNQQRELIYFRRRHAILEDSLKEDIFAILEGILEGRLANPSENEEYLKNFCRNLRFKFLLNFHPENFSGLSKEEIIKKVIELSKLHYAKKEKILGEEKTQNLEKMITLGVIDSNWKDYLFSMDQLREGIMWRSYGQKDPLVEYQHEAFAMFGNLINTIDEDIVERLFKTFAIEEKFTQRVFKSEEETFIHEEYSALEGLPQPLGEGPPKPPMPDAMPDTRPGRDATHRRKTPKVGRNDPCPCGSGRKHKKCCGK